MSMRSTARQRLALNAACVLTLIALALMVWSVLVPKPGPVMVAMTVAAGLGTCGGLLFGYAVIVDLVRARVLATEPAAATEADGDDERNAG